MIKSRELLLYSSIVGAVAAAALGYWAMANPEKKPAEVINSTPAPIGEPDQERPSSVPRNRPAVAADSGDVQVPGGTYEPKDPRWEERRMLLAIDQAYEWRTPLSFYGMVIDQQRQPVSGAEVEVSWTNLTRTGSTTEVLATGNDGRFALTGQQGKHLVVTRLSKSGYVEARQSNRYAFEYAGFWEPTFHVPDPKTPVIFHLRKKRDAEPMIHRESTLYQATNDGLPTYYDLAAGGRTTERLGDLAIRFVVGPDLGRGRFDWSGNVAGVNGAGLILSNDEFMIEAPKDGYQESLDFREEAKREDFHRSLSLKMFVRTGKGNFARLEVTLLPKYSDSAAVRLEVFLNPSGSTNLEFDPGTLAPGQKR